MHGSDVPAATLTASIMGQQPSREDTQIWKEFKQVPPKTLSRIVCSQGLSHKAEIFLLMTEAVERYPAITPTALPGLLLHKHGVLVSSD